MLSFFKGWRRKAGLAILAIAFGLMIALSRSILSEETVRFDVGEIRHELVSGKSVLRWRWWNREGWVSLRQWDIEEYHELTIQYCPLILVLSVLSAGLILWKPQESVPPLHEGPSCRVAH